MIQSIKEKLKLQKDSEDLILLNQAIETAQKYHQSQQRLSGESVFDHVLGVALIVVNELKLGIHSVVAALLHDIVSENTGYTFDHMKTHFPKEVTSIVDGVTKLTQAPYESKNERRAAAFRKMIQILTLDDIRVIFIKLADRLHNMRTLKFIPEKRQIQKATETHELYTPIAHKLGLYNIKSELEDLSFKFLDRPSYLKVARLLAEKKDQREAFIEKTLKELQSILNNLNITGEISGRAKHIYSIHEKLQRSGKDFNQLYDLTAFRIIVDEKEACYQILGEIHAQYTAISGRFKDYISLPKSNNYRSLHTAVHSNEGRIVEIQIRTFEMHAIAENGIAAHWAYKAKRNAAVAEQHEINTLKKIVKYWLDEALENKESVESLTDEFKNKERQIYIFTPGGDVVILTEGATLLDFAFHVHTELGNHCTGGTVDGINAPLKQVLRSGQRVSITQTKNQHPKIEWLDFTTTQRARSKISNYIHKSERKQAKEIGLSLLDRQFAKQGLNFNKLYKEGVLEQQSKKTRYANLTEISIAVGSGKMKMDDALEKLLPEEYQKEIKQNEQNEQEKFDIFFKQFDHKERAARDGVVIDGIEDIQIKFARCCNPIPNEPIIGFISMGHGVTIHRQNCKNIHSLPRERLIPTSWHSAGAQRPVITSIRVLNKVGVLSDITKSLSKMAINIESMTALKDDMVGTGEILMTLSISDIDILNKLRNHLLKIAGVLQVEFRRTAQ